MVMGPGAAAAAALTLCIVLDVWTYIHTEVSFWVRLESCHVRVVVWLEERVWTWKIDELVTMTVRRWG